MRKQIVAAFIVLVIVGTTLVFAQTSPSGSLAPVRFEVVSIKQNTSGRIESFAYPYANTGRLTLINHTAMQMIRQAYELWDYQVVGGPEWLDRTRFDLEAKAEAPTTREGLMLRLRALLGDEFKLKTRLEDREGPILRFVRARPGKIGPNLIAAQPEDAQLYPVGAKEGGMRGRAATMADLAATLSNVQHRLVVDQTGLAGIYNFELDYLAERRVPPGVPADALPPRNEDLPALPTALDQQLGLRLESARGPVPTLVVISAQLPHTE